MENKDIHFSFDQEQLNKIVEQFKAKAPEKKFNLDKFLNVVQVIALVISGCWIFYKYLAHEKESNELTNENLKLQKDNLQLQNNLHKQMDDYTVLLDEMDIQRARQDSTLKEVDIRYRKRLTIAEYNSKQLDVESQKINLQYAGALKMLEEEHNLIKFKGDSIKLVRDEDNRYECTSSFSCKLVDTLKKLYVGNFKIEIKNVSDVEYNISGAVIGIYLSKFNLLPSNNPEVLLSSIGSPPDMYHNGSNGDWKLISQKAFYCWDCSYDFRRDLSYYLEDKASTPIRGGLFTGRLKSGAKVFSNYSFFFTSDSDNVMGINLEIIFNDRFVDTYHLDAYRILKYLQFSPDNQ